MPDSEGLSTAELAATRSGATPDVAEVTGATAVDEQSLWSAVRESLRGSHRDYTSGPIGRAIIMLAIPMVLEMCMESIFAVVDIKWVSYLGPDAMATVGLTESLMTLVYTLAIGLSIRTQAMLRMGTGLPPAQSMIGTVSRRLSVPSV